MQRSAKCANIADLLGAGHVQDLAVADRVCEDRPALVTVQPAVMTPIAQAAARVRFLADLSDRLPLPSLDQESTRTPGFRPDRDSHRGRIEDDPFEVQIAVRPACRISEQFSIEDHAGQMPCTGASVLASSLR